MQENPLAAAASILDDRSDLLFGALIGLSQALALRTGFEARARAHDILATYRSHCGRNPLLKRCLASFGVEIEVRISDLC